MDGYLLDPHDAPPPAPRAARRAQLRARVLEDALARAHSAGVQLVVEPARRVTDLAMLWFEGDRASVLRTVGGWTPDDGVILQIAHARACAGRYELVLYASLERPSRRQAA